MHSDLSALEFGGIQRLLEKLTSTPYGAEAARNLTPAPTVAVARQMQTAVSAARTLIEAGNAPKLERLPDIRAALRQAAQSGAALPGSALHNIRTVLATTATLADVARQTPGLYAGASADLQAPADLPAALAAALLPGGNIRHDANAALLRLHGEIETLRTELQKLLKARLQANDLKGAVASERVYWQGHRGMLSLSPAIAERVKGVRRGASTNGREVIIEPLEAVGLNNKLESLGGQQELEQQLLRRSLTDAVRAHGAALARIVEAITWIDLALAGGHLSVHLNATPPEFVAAPRIELDRAYHPAMLLQFAQGQGPRPVPLSVALDDAQPMLLITGPNTGGKTVVLKTVGLLVTMAYCGLHLPVEGRCVIGDFTRVIVGIGDAQSLQHHLSTFAGHVEVLKRLLHEADAGTLVLMDELGTGTDPEEGAALAMAVLDELSERRVRGIVTTHLPPLKGYAERHPALQNASMHFDRASLAPTYRLEVGVSGRSLGLVIAGQRGLPDTLLDRARAHLRAINPHRQGDE